jgi:Secretion system C-terminal sorting domain
VNFKVYTFAFSKKIKKYINHLKKQEKMKKRILLVTAISGLIYLTISSYKAGPANNGYDCTGAETGLGNPAGCSTGTGCHGTSATTGITVAIELDSAGIPTTHYKAGMTYTVKIKGTNTTANTLPKFGFQLGVIKGTTAATTPLNAGTWATTGLPTSTRYSAASPGNYVLNIVEHSSAIVATTGTGATGSTYVESLSWTAPVSGTGPISIWGALNAVNANNSESGDFWNTNHVTINEWVSTASVATVVSGINLKAYPNPVANTLNLQIENAGSYSVQVFDVSGKSIANQHIELNGGQSTNINSSDWAPGMYFVVVEKDGARQVVPVVKN